MFKKSLILTSAIFTLVGCTPSSSLKPLPSTKRDTPFYAKVEKALQTSQQLQQKHSKWFQRDDKIPLTIITTAYINPKATKTKEYYAYKKLVKKLEKNPSLLGEDIAQRFSPIIFKDYAKDQLAQEKFNIAYRLKHEDKESLTDALRPTHEKSSAEILLHLNFEELQNGNLTIEGYKTIKQDNLQRNSYYYKLRKINYKKLTKKQKNSAIIHSLQAALQLSIPEYVSIDRIKLIKKDEILRYIAPQKDGEYKGEIWKYTTNNEVARLLTKIQNSNFKIKEIQLNTNYQQNSYGTWFQRDIKTLQLSSDAKYLKYYIEQVDTPRYTSVKTGKHLNSKRIKKLFDRAYNTDTRYTIRKDGNGNLVYADKKNNIAIYTIKFSSSKYSGPYAINYKKNILAVEHHYEYTGYGSFVTLYDLNKINKIYNQILKIKELNRDRDLSNKQIIFTTKLPLSDLQTLYNNNYISSIQHPLELSTLYQLQDSLNINLFDPVIASHFHSLLNNDMQMFSKSYLFEKKDNFNLNDIFFSSAFNLAKNNWKKIKEIKGIDLREEDLFSYKDGIMIEKAIISKDGKYALALDYDSNLIYVDLVNLRVIKTIPSVGSLFYDIQHTSCRFTPDGKYALIYIYKDETDTLHRIINLQTFKFETHLKQKPYKRTSTDNTVHLVYSDDFGTLHYANLSMQYMDLIHEHKIKKYIRYLWSQY